MLKKALIISTLLLFSGSTFAYTLNVTNDRPKGQYNDQEQRVVVKANGQTVLTLLHGQSGQTAIPDNVTQVAIYAYGAYDQQPIPAGFNLRDKNGTLYIGESVNDASSLTTTATLISSINNVSLPTVSSGQSFDDYNAGQSAGSNNNVVIKVTQ